MSTITVPDYLPPPEIDAEKLRKAFQGWGTDEKAVIDILAHRTAPQRLAIAAAYFRLYNEILLQRLRSELSGDFRKAVMSWTEDPVVRDAKLIHKALNMKDDRHVWIIIEVACATSPDHLIAVRKAYHTLHDSSIEEDIAHHYAELEPLRQLLVRLVTSYRFSGEDFVEELAKAEAAELHDAIRQKQPHKEEVIRIISTRNKSQLKRTFTYYEQSFGRPIDMDIKASGSSQFSTMLKAAVWCIASAEKHYAEVVRSSIIGLGTDDSTLIRAIVSRAEIDMKKIKEEYKKAYNTTLNDDVKGDTSGNYENFLLTLIGPVNS